MLSPLRASCLLAGLALIVAGCGGGGNSTSTTEPVTAIGLSLDACAEAEYGGNGTPEALIVSDLPMLGDSAERSRQQVQAIRIVLEQSGWKAGETPVAFQACDDSIEQTGLWDEARCRSNAEAYAGDGDVIGVVGTYNSGCAAIEIPILNRAKLAMVSPGNTAVCLTEKSPTCESGQPQSLYPTGARNYARVIPNDAFQGAALADFAAKQGIERPAILYAADDPTSTGQATNFRGAATALGLDLADYTTWDPEAGDYRQLFERVKMSGPDGVVLAGLIEQNGAQLIRDKAAILGSNDEVPLISFDGFAQQTTIDDSGPAAAGMFASVPGSAPESLSGAGKALVEELTQSLDGQPVEQFAPYAGEATALLLDAIDKAGPDRAGVVKAVFATREGGGILDPYEIGPSGDPSVGAVTILRAGSAFEPDEEVRPRPPLVEAAALG